MDHVSHFLSRRFPALALLCSFGIAGPAKANARAKPTKTPAQAATKPAAPAAKVMVGAYVMSLYDLNPANNTFTSDLWLWFVHDKSADLKPLKTIEPENARDFKTSL